MDDLINRAQVAALRMFTLIAGLLLTLAAVWASVEAGILERRWQNVVLCSVSALFIGGAGVWLRRRIEADRASEIERRQALEMSTLATQSSVTPTLATQSSVTPTRSAQSLPHAGSTPDASETASHEATFE
jgi:hypothetical protein